MKNVRRAFSLIFVLAVILYACAPAPAPQPLPFIYAPAVDAGDLIPQHMIARDKNGRIERDRSVGRAFQRQVPCPDRDARAVPATQGGTRGACPGFEIDHRVALCRGGTDTVENMQWMWDQEHDLKTREDVKICAGLRAAARAAAGERRSP